MIDYLRKPVRAVIRNLAILPGVDPNRLLPLGGTAGQFPMKASDEDGDIVWADFQVDDELSLDSEFPVQNKVVSSELYRLQSQLDGIPFPSSDDPLMDGEADPGESPDFARADHRHPFSMNPFVLSASGSSNSLTVTWSGGKTASELVGTGMWPRLKATVNGGDPLSVSKVSIDEAGKWHFDFFGLVTGSDRMTSAAHLIVTAESGSATSASGVYKETAIISGVDVPTKTSDLTNDSGFITAEDVPVSEPARITFTASGASMSQLSVSWPSGKTAGQLAIAPNPLYAEIDYVIQLSCVSRAVTMPNYEYEFVFAGVDVYDGANHPKIGVLVVTAASASATSGTGVYTTYSLT